MDPCFRSSDKSTGNQKENSPPGGYLDVQHEQPGAKQTADGLSLNNANQGQTAAFMPFQANVRKIDQNIVQQLQQPLQPRNSLIPANKESEKVQPELLKKFRQLRQWQQQQQDSMFKQQQEQMATLKMQQDKLQLLYQKAVRTTGSPSSMAYGPGDCQRTGKQSPFNNMNCKEANEQKRNISMESFFKSLKTQEKLETLVNPNQNIYHRPQGSPTRNSSATSPVLMTPMQFMSPTSYSRPHICSPEDFSLSRPTHPSMQQNALNLSPSAALQKNIPCIPEYDKGRDYGAISLDDQSDLESQPDYQSDCDTMSGVYPIQDDMSEACSTEMENEQRSLDVEEEEESDEDGNSDLESTVRERVDPDPAKAAMNEEERPINPGIGKVSMESALLLDYEPSVTEGTTKAATFEELLERELSNEQQNQGEQQKSPSPVKPQKKFLKKGQGLARFNMKPTIPKKQKTVNQKASASLPPLRQVSKSQKEERKNMNNPPVRQETKGTSKQLLTVPQNKVQRKIAGRTASSTSGNQPPKSSPQEYGSSVLASHVIGPFSSLPHGIPITKTTGAVTKTTLTSVRRDGSPLLLSPLVSLDASFQKQEKEWEEMKEEEDLEEFEMLEQAAANASFSSNSSLVVKVIERARTQKPGHQAVSVRKIENGVTTSRNSQVPSILSPVDTGYGSGEGRGTGSVIIGSQTGSMSSVEDASTSDNESTEEEEEEDDNDTTLQEMDSDDAESSPPDTDQLLPSMTQPQHGSRGSDTAVPSSVPTLTTPDEFDDQEAWGEIKAQTNPNDTDSDDDSDDTDVTISDVFPVNTSLKMIEPQLRDSTNPSDEFQQISNPGSKSDNVMSTPPTSALVSKLFPKLKPKAKVEESQVTNPPTAPVVTDSGPSKEVQEKLKELEEEINKFRAENKALAKIRNERDEGLKRLQKEIDSFEKQKLEELERLEKFREEEMQKLRRERRTFEKYQKATRNNPDKKEREEIEALRSQVAELQEEIKCRESRWSAASSRYRSRIEALEEQNKELQEEVKLLEKYRLEKWRNDEMKAKDNEEAKPRDVVLRKTKKPAEPARNEALNHPLNYEVMQKEDTIRQSPQQKPSPLKQQEIKTIDINNNNKTKANDSAIKQSPRDKSMNVVNGVEGPRVTSDPGLNQPESGEPLKTEDKNTSFPSVVPGMRKLALQEIEHPDGKVEHVKPDGSRVIMFANGTRKEISMDGQTIIVSFFNGDIKQVFPDQRVVYYYSDAKTTHTTYPDGLEVLQFPNNQIEKHYVDGTKEIIFPDQTIKYLYVDGTEECVFADGTIQRMRAGDGERIIEFPNGQREVHTKHYKRREYPDGTVKTVYPDGRTETRYSTGRLRVKDRDGRVLVDTVERLLQE